MRNYKINILKKKNNFPEVLGSRKMQNQKTSRKPKKKNNFPEVLEMEEVRQETQNIVFFGFFVFFGFLTFL